MRGLLLLFFLAIGLNVFCQAPKLSEKAQISVLTCAAGDELYYSFGHTAFRVQDPVLNIDVVYNYGTFDFNQPNFYWNFTKGRLLYTLTRRSFETFLFEYELEMRWVKEQILNLSIEEVNQVFNYLEWNYQPENRDYLYDPLFDNCSTVITTILTENFGKAIKYNNPNKEVQDLGFNLNNDPTFRQLVNSHLPTNSWGAWGINLAFGAVVDREASLRERMFLPYQALAQIRVAEKNNSPLLYRERFILDYPEKKPSGSFMTSPLFWFMMLLVFVIAITFLDYKHQNRNTYLDFVLFLVSGGAGIIILLLWFATDHVYTKLNFNFLWLFPFNFVAAFTVVKKGFISKKMRNYLWILLGLLLVTILLWIFRFQVFSPLNIPLILIFGTRYLFLLNQQKLQYV